MRTKSRTIENLWCYPKNLVLVLNDLQQGRYKTVVTYDNEIIFPNKKEFIGIAVQRKKTEYHILCNYYRILDN